MVCDYQKDCQIPHCPEFGIMEILEDCGMEARKINIGWTG